MKTKKKEQTLALVAQVVTRTRARSLLLTSMRRRRRGGKGGRLLLLLLPLLPLMGSASLPRVVLEAEPSDASERGVSSGVETVGTGRKKSKKILEMKEQEELDEEKDEEKDEEEGEVPGRGYRHGALRERAKKGERGAAVSREPAPRLAVAGSSLRPGLAGGSSEGEETAGEVAGSTSVIATAKLSCLTNY